MAKHNVLGQKGEDLAAQYFEQQGYVVLDRNWHCGHKELDLVVTKASTVVFVEVKTRSTTGYGSPCDAVTQAKIRRIVSSADAYLRYNCIDMDVRFDIVSIVIENGQFKVEHIEQAFYAPIE